MKKTIQRLLIFFIGLPLIAGLVVFLPHYHHLALNLVIVIFCALGAAEFSALLAPKNIIISKAEAAILGTLPPLVMFLIVRLNLSEVVLSAVIAAVVSWLLVSGIFSRGAVINGFLNRLSAGFAVLLYPGMLAAWLVRMSQWEEYARVIISVFLITVFCTDGTAWAAGKLFGKGNQGLIPVSPKKSVAGFIGGIFASIIVGTAAALLFPEIFVSKYPIAGSLLGLLTGLAAAFGDLGESAIKRSSGIKDSGTIIPGRGGILDSIDSVIFAAPVFYIAFRLLFTLP
jgi:phosphatidate cytidylyltransferase